MQNIDHTQARDAKPGSPLKTGDRVRCILFDGSIVDGAVVGKTAFYVNVDVDGEPLSFDFDDVFSAVVSEEDFHLRAKIVSGRFHTQLGLMNTANRSNAIAARAVPA
ncbi:hypothetical protein [Gimesia algae]|uniref:Uncharacterized protein n=1 Tax=Gimesia algae TaxID=2527971 RepID=A0A517VMJ1_9PLAN|nr:hypothetical protein [Gimesia algae]QDT94195.1 hypothetical protein Pan161_58890 [Gimesia algae]